MKLFKEELEKIDSVDIRTFAHNALVAAPESFKRDEELITYTKKVFKVTEELLDADRVEGNVRDVILVGVLLSDIAKNVDERFEESHPFLVRPLLKDVKDDLVPQLFEGIMRIVESHEGAHTPIKALEPKPGSAEHLVALANVIVRSESIDVKV